MAVFIFPETIASMKKPKKQRNVTRKLKKKHQHELKRKEVRKQQKMAYIETLKSLKGLSEEELNKILGEEEVDEEY